MHTDWPKKPRNVAGSIQKVQGLELDSIIVINWSLPENNNRTTIDYYEVTLIGNTNTSTRVYVGAQADPQQSLSHILQVDSEKNYTSASILAVDVCRQQSEPSLFDIIPAMTGSTSTTPNSNGTIQAGYLGAIILIVLAFLVLYKIMYH